MAQVATQSSYFPFGSSGCENQVPARRTALVNFPKAREVLWDSEKTGNSMTLHLSCSRNITVKIAEKTIRLAYQHAVHAKTALYQGFFVGSIETDAEEEGIVAVLTRFDPGRDIPHGREPVLTAKLPGDFVVPVCFSFEKGDRGQQTHGEKDFSLAFQFLEHSTSSRGGVDLTSTLSLRIHCSCYEGSDDITLSLHHGAVTVGTPVDITPINSIPIIPTALARNLAGPINISQLQKSHKFGFITMDQTRKLLLLLDTDPKAYALPLIGIWVSGVNFIHSPVVYAACLKFLFSKSIQDRATSPSGGFVLLFYSPLHKHPQFYECTKGNDAHNLTFDLIGCKEQLHIFKHKDGSSSPDVHFELTAARGGPSKELFLQALRKFDPPSPSPNASQQRASTSEDDPHLVPRPSPKPTMTKSPSVLPSVPEVSLIFDNSENVAPVGKRRSPPPSASWRPGPLRDLNQGPAQIRSAPHIGRRHSTVVDQENSRNARNGPHVTVPRRNSCGSSPPGCRLNQEGDWGPSAGKESKRRGSLSRKSKTKKGHMGPEGPVNLLKENSVRQQQGIFTPDGSRTPEIGAASLETRDGSTWNTESLDLQHGRCGPPPQTMNHTYPCTNSHGSYGTKGPRNSDTVGTNYNQRGETDLGKNWHNSRGNNTNPGQRNASGSKEFQQQRSYEEERSPMEHMSSSHREHRRVSSDEGNSFVDGCQTDSRHSCQHQRFNGGQGHHTMPLQRHNSMPAEGHNTIPLDRHTTRLHQELVHDQYLGQSPHLQNGKPGEHFQQHQHPVHHSQSDPSLLSHQKSPFMHHHHGDSRTMQSLQHGQQSPQGSGVQYGMMSPLQHQQQKGDEFSQHQQPLQRSSRQSTSPVQPDHGLLDHRQQTQGHFVTSGQAKGMQQSHSNLPLHQQGKTGQSLASNEHQTSPRQHAGSHQTTSPLHQQNASADRIYPSHPVGQRTLHQTSQTQHPTRVESTAVSPERSWNGSNGGISSGGSCGQQGSEESPFVQLKKQEKMIEQLQEQIKFLLQMQAGSISPGLMTPPATPPSSKGPFSFPTPDSSGGNAAPALTLPTTVIPPAHHVQGVNLPKADQRQGKQTATISTNTGQSLFFGDQSSLPPPMYRREGLSMEETSGGSPRQEAYREGHLDGPTTDSSVPGSVSDSVLSGDPGFHVDLQNTKDDSQSLGSRVELTSYPDSASVKSSEEGSPTKEQRSEHATPSRSQSVNSGDDTIVTSPPMPTLVSPVLGESASTCQPKRPYQNTWQRGGARNHQAIPEESSEGSQSDHAGMVQTPSLLQRDQRQFYQNLLGNVDNFLHDDDDVTSSSHDDELGSTSSSEYETSEEDELESATLDGPEKSMLFRSLMSTPDFHPHINYVSLTAVGLGPSDISMEADAIAMKYLSDEELATMSSETRNGGTGQRANPLLRNVLTAGLPAHMAAEKSMYKSRVEFSFATRKYLEKHGLGDASKTAGESTGMERKKEKVKRKRKRKKEDGKRGDGEMFERVLPLKRAGQEEGVGCQQLKPQNEMEQAASSGNILDWNKLKTLPKLL